MLLLLIIGSFLIIYGMLIILGKHTITFTKPILGMGIGLVLLSLIDLLQIIQYPDWFKWIMVIVMTHAIIWISFLWLYAKNRRMQTPDIIFVFGAGLIENRLSRSLKARLDKAYELSQQFPQCPIIVSGGQGKDEWLSEAEAMQKNLVSRGVDENRILMEDRSTTTQENLVFSMKKYDLNNKKIALVSNQFHVYRTEKMAFKLGLEGFGVPAYLYHIGIPAFYIREYLACIKAFIKQEI